MVSRKRNKGKERKAKQTEAKAENEKAKITTLQSIWREWAHGIIYVNKIENVVIPKCDHGCNMLIAADNDNHPVSRFMNEYFLNCLHKGMLSLDNVRALFTAHQEFWNNVSHRKTAINILVRIGTNVVLTKASGQNWHNYLAVGILAVENYNGESDIQLVLDRRSVASKLIDLAYVGISTRRDELKFYSKRITCSCLKKMHSDARKAMPKLGGCNHCKVEQARALLRVCSRCRITQYCSKECQVADWPNHVLECDAFVYANETDNGIFLCCQVANANG